MIQATTPGQQLIPVEDIDSMLFRITGGGKNRRQVLLAKRLSSELEREGEVSYNGWKFVKQETVRHV